MRIIKLLILNYFMWASGILAAECQNIKQQILLSNSGSSRATAYELSNKILSNDKYIYTTYLDYENENHVIKFSKIQRENLVVVNTITIGKARDNHGGGSIVRDSKNNFHIFYGSHITAMKYRYNTDGEKLENWSEEITFGNGLTYPSAVISSKDEILLVARLGYKVYQQNPWSYVLYSIKDKKITYKGELIQSRRHDDDFVNRYIHYFTQMVIDKNDKIHLAFLLYERSKNNPPTTNHSLGYGIGYLSSNDLGDSWTDSSGQTVELPAKIDYMNLLEGVKESDLATNYYRSLSITIESKTDNPIVGYTEYHLKKQKWSTWLNKQIDGEWTKSIIAEGLYKISLYSALNDTLYILGEKLLDPNAGIEEGWSNPNTKMVLLSSKNNSKFIEDILSNSSLGPHWYPSLLKPSSSVGNLTAPYGLYMSNNQDGLSNVTLTKLD